MVLGRSDPLQRAERIALAFEGTQRAMWSGIWPHGHCFVASLTLAPLLRAALEWEVHVVVGRAYRDFAHAWIESPDGDIIDLTYGQFDRGRALLVRRAADVPFTSYRPLHHLSLDQEEHYRRAIKIWTGEKGWAKGCGIEELFGLTTAKESTDGAVA